MVQIRQQTIFSSIVIYIGFVIGFINIYLFTKDGSFTPQQFGLTRLITDLGITFYSFASLGVVSYVYKFLPYYKDNLRSNENDQASWSLLICSFGFVLVAIAAVLLKPLFIQKFSARSGLLITYYYCILPFSFGFLLFTVFEAFAWFAERSILSNFLKETGTRLLQLFLILLFICKAITFDTFVIGFAFTYLVIASILIFHLYYTGKI